MGVECLLTRAIEAGRRFGAITDHSLKRVAVDTTAMEKTIAHPRGVRLYERARAMLVGLSKKADIEMRQSFARVAPGDPDRPLRSCPPVPAHAHANERLDVGLAGRGVDDGADSAGEVALAPEPWGDGGGRGDGVEHGGFCCSRQANENMQGTNDEEKSAIMVNGRASVLLA